MANAGKEMVGMRPASVLLLDDSLGTRVSKMDLVGREGNCAKYFEVQMLLADVVKL